MNDDHQILFNIKVMINAEKLRKLDDDPRDGYYSTEHIKQLQEIYDRFKELSSKEYERKLAERLQVRAS